jgi:DNA repair photolyase
MERIDAELLDTPRPRRGRGAVTAPAGRFAASRTERRADGWDTDPEFEDSVITEIRPEKARTLISRNDSPDVPFDRSINPYRGCEHGCVYCYARPAHAYVDLSPGLDFETRLLFKDDAAAMLQRELARPGYHCRPIAFGTNTDPYQPVERRLRITRSLLEVCSEHDHPVTITTRGAAVLDDLDLLADLAQRRLVSVAVSLTTLDDDLKRRLEPRAAAPATRLRMMRTLADAGVPVMVMTAPIIPAINDRELEAMLEAAAAVGAGRATWILLRLPHEVGDLFRDWLQIHFPDRAEHVLSLVRQTRQGRRNDPRFGTRMTGSGPWAELLRRRFEVAAGRLDLLGPGPSLDCSRFRPPDRPQLDLF